MKLGIRFKGFNDEWVERKLGNITDRFDSNRKAVAATKRIKGDIPYYGAVGVQGYIDGYTHDGEYLLIAEDGASSMLDYPVRVTSGKIWVNNHAHVLAGLTNVADNKYLRNKLSTIDMTPYITGGSRHKLTTGDLEIIKIQLPTLPEQQKIGALFSKYDGIIAVREQKLEELNALKKGLLQQMFDDSHKPQVRFSGFNDEWVEKRLGDVYSFSKGAGISKQSLSMDKSLPKGIPYGDLFTIYNSVIKDVERSTTDINGPTSNGTEILIPASSTVPLGPAQVSAILQSDVRLGGDIIIGKPQNNDLSNIFVAISATANKHKMYRFISGSTISHISAIGAASVPIQLPSLPEQEKIGELFKHLDDRISNEQNKIEQLKAQKKGLLQRML